MIYLFLALKICLIFAILGVLCYIALLLRKRAIPQHTEKNIITPDNADKKADENTDKTSDTAKRQLENFLSYDGRPRINSY